MPTELLDPIPLSVLAAGTVIVTLLALEAGFRFGCWRRLRSGGDHEALGGVVGATLGLLAFLLAFTFGMAASRFEDRRQVLLEEANLIGDSFLRADLIGEPHRSAVRRLLKEYVDVRLEAALTGDLAQAAQRSEQLQQEIWSHVVAVGTADPSSEMKALFVDSINAVISTHTKRLTVARTRIPSTIWLALYAMTIVAMTTVGYQFGVSGARRSPAMPALALTFSMVIALIADLDRPLQGLLRVNQQAMIDLQRTMATSP